MQLPNSLKPGILVRRYKRFLADIDFNGKIITVHCPNPGSMIGLSSPGLKVWCSFSNDKKRKYPYTLEIIEVENNLVGINTLLPNKIVKEALINKKIPSLKSYDQIFSEFKFNKGTRFDFMLKGKNLPPVIIEVKNVHMCRKNNSQDKVAEFPDSITSRGSKHLMELSNAISQGYRAIMIYVIQRGDCKKFSIADDIDPEYAKNFLLSQKNGVEVQVWVCDISIKEIKLSRQLVL
tara:strand:+ start:736 stop:1440 length:705 start_codon:yes stop_codon:yes gene_type:complete